MDNPVGRQPTVFPRFWLQPVRLSKILQNLWMVGNTNESAKVSIWTRTSVPVRVYVPAPFLLDTARLFVYSVNMLTGIRIFTTDPYWRAIVLDLNATSVDDANLADVDLDSLKFNSPVTSLELKSIIITALDDTKVLASVFGRSVSLSPIQRQIVVRLKKSGGMSADELKLALGYVRDTTTHTVDTAIYGLRKLFGRDFIKNENGIFKIGGI